MEREESKMQDLMDQPEPKKPLCPGAWAVPPSPRMLERVHDYYACSECGEPCDTPKKNTCTCGAWATPDKPHASDCPWIEPKQSQLERGDYARLKLLELQGIADYRELSQADVLTPERVLTFINQLSPWNLKITGRSILDIYVQKQEARLQPPTADKPESGVV